MATNQYFTSNYTGYSAEQSLVHDLTIESHQIFGVDLKYLPRTLVNYDSLYGEDNHSSFKDAIVLEFYIKSFNGFMAGPFINQFGPVIPETLMVTCARKRFEATVTEQLPEIKRPREGDLIYIPYAVDERQRVYEISYVNQDENFSQLGERYTWEMTIRVFGHNGEAFDTGDSEIDEFDGNYLAMDIKLAVGAGVFVMGDTVTQSNGFQADVVNFDSGTNILTLTNSFKELDITLPITNGTVTRSVDGIDNAVVNDSGLNDNKLIAQKEIVLIDSTEDNPFSGF